MSKPDYVIILTALSEFQDAQEKMYSDLDECPESFTVMDKSFLRSNIRRAKDEIKRIESLITVRQEEKTC